MKRIVTGSLLMMGCLSSVPVLAQGDWQHGIGTGIYLLNIEGDTGADTALGSVLVKTDLDNEEVSDLIESAIGLGGFSTNGTWTILYNAGQLEMAGSGSGSDLLGTPASGSGSLTATSAELAAVYNFAVTGGHYWGALLGVRYTEHEYEVDLTIGASPTTLGLTESWTDAIVGLTHTYPISEKWTWNNTANIGFGSGTDGTYYIKTGLTRQFAENWSSTFYGQLLHYDYENGTRGDADWYLYDTDEYGLGVTILYHY